MANETNEMSAELKKLLKELGVSEASTAKLEVEEVLTVEGLQQVVMTTSSMVELKGLLSCSLLAATAIWNHFRTAKPAAAEPTPEPTPAKPAAEEPKAAKSDQGAGFEMLAGVFASMVPLDQQPLANLLTRLACGERDPLLQRAIQRHTRGLHCFVEGDDGKLDVQDTIAALEFMSTTGQAPGSKTCFSLDEILNQVLQACPWGGSSVPLDPSETNPDGLSWKGIPTEARIAIRMARKNGTLPDSVDSFIVVEQIRGGNRGGRLQKVFDAYKQAERRQPQLVQAAMAELTYVRPSSTGGRYRDLPSSGQPREFLGGTRGRLDE